ncbi:dynamin family protein [Aquibacillus albus]|uniref:Small GTP-binding protein n=1 Tax=Aquibacillus albus TaxID=1168171 RepID=A0ABS2N229_9BACI|nr:dynamin family protein [Aquibacillus albus]MBM7572148.1 small GTP-binding protein [Aquibacillus albus]
MSPLVTNSVNPATIAAFYKEYKEADHIKLANKTLDLLDKNDNSEYVVCFSGHFSAGKSTMINHLIGQDVLPQSPIPTSANVVKISSGEGFARVFFNKQDPVEYKEPYDMETIKTFCKDGDAINRVEISKDTRAIPANVSILDTPGIDSANDADRIMTESSLHIVDVIFYVMDYNHVQSEVNLLFLKEMQDRGKPIFIVINQIDKHHDSELSFEAFKNSVNETLANWGIIPEQIFYTSVLDMNQENNEIHDLEVKIQELMNFGHYSLEETIEKSLSYFIEQHIEWLEDKNQAKKDKLMNELDHLRIVNETSLDSRAVEANLEHLTYVEENAFSEFQSEVDKTLKNAYIMPFELREKAEAVLHSQQKGFKVGIFSTRKKTEAERQRRLNELYEPLMKTVKASIEWKLREKLLSFAKKYGVQQSTIIEKIQALSIAFQPDDLVQLIKPGAGITGEYLLIFTQDIANTIKQHYKQVSVDVWNDIKTILTEDTKGKMESLSNQLESKKQQERLQKELMLLDENIENQRQEFSELLAVGVNEQTTLTDAREQVKNRYKTIQLFEGVPEKQAETNTLNGKEDKSFIVDEPKSHKTVDTTIKDIETVISTIRGLPGFDAMIKDLSRRRERLENKQYTVALFGAFSAGKSSFANALLGEKVLPVSPNPTTAAINKISPPNDQYEHGTVVVKIKNEKDLLDELEQIVEVNSSYTSLQPFIQLYRSEAVDKDNRVTNKHKLFVESVMEGYEQLGEYLGKQLTINLNEFPDYVSKESLACYVEWMELYYDCALTSQGITLVDTPGADSINARHTDVSFEYIKQSDAILFVTYYNHPFSKADREFLIQLGRVKDAFSLDKMFFIINAADLAKNEEELDMVKTYISDQLLQFGVKQPRMFALSSNEAIKEKSGENTKSRSGIEKFEKAFDHFVHHEIMDLFVQSTYHDMKRIKNTMKKYLDAASLNKEEKQLQISQYETELDSIATLIKESGIDSYFQEIEQKIEKQIYYVNQRHSIQFGDRFKESFNPSTIKSKGKDAKSELKSSLQKMMKDIGYELAQELRAVSLRIEFFIQQKAVEWNNKVENECNAIHDGLTLPKVEDVSLTTPGFKTAFDHLDLSIFNSALNQFKNTRAFFEKNEKEEMKEVILEQIKPLVSDYLQENQQMLKEHYNLESDQLFTKIKEKAGNAAEQYYNGLKHSLTDEINVEDVREKVKQLNMINF